MDDTSYDDVDDDKSHQQRWLVVILAKSSIFKYQRSITNIIKS